MISRESSTRCRKRAAVARTLGSSIRSLCWSASIVITLPAFWNVKAFAVDSSADSIRLRIAEATLSFPQGRPPCGIQATLTNNRAEPIVLVTPGDGSEVGLRTPITGWSILSASLHGKTDHPKIMPPQPSRGFGEINAPKATEVFVLPPSRSRTIRISLRAALNLRRGRYAAVCYYINDPSFRITTQILDREDLRATSLIARSTRCSLHSNEVIFVVK